MSKRLREWRLSRARAARVGKACRLTSRPDRRNSPDKRMTSTRSAKASRTQLPSALGIWLSYLFVLLYIGIAAGAVTHRDLLLENPVKLPFLGVDLPLVAFFFLAPILFIVSHAYTLMHFVMLAAKVGVFDAELRAQLGDAPETWEGLRRQLPSNIFVQFLAGPRDIRKGGARVAFEGDRLDHSRHRPGTFVASDPGAIFALSSLSGSPGCSALRFSPT